MLDQRRQDAMHGGTREPERALQIDEAHALLPAVAEAGEDADPAIERLHAHQLTFLLSNSRLIFDVCDSPVCGSSSCTPTGDTIVRRPITSLSRRSKSCFTAAPCAARSSTSTITVSSSRPLSPKRSITQKNSPLLRLSSATATPIASVNTLTPRTFTMLSLRP